MNRIISILCLSAAMAACQSNPKIQWVTTTPESSWQTRDAADVSFESRPDAQVVVDIDNPQQTIDGFGTCFNELGWTSLSLLTDAERDSIFRELFKPGYGANFTICRMPVAANDFSRNWYSYNETDGDFEMVNFSIANDEETLIPFIKEALRQNPELKIWASPWSPPSWMKRNGHYACAMSSNSASNYSNGLKPEQQGKEGTDMFIQDDRYLSAYALYFAKFIEAYREKGIDISTVMPQNEFNSCQVFPSCTWTAAGLNRFVGKYLGPKMEEIGVDVAFGTMERPNAQLVDTLLQDSLSSRYIKGVGFQWAGKDAIGKIHRDYPDMKLYQTEQECGDGKNNWNSCMYSWDLMKHYIDNGVSVYDYWNTSLEDGGISRWGWSQNSLISVNPDTRTYRYNPEYYLLKHFSHYVLPGAKYLPVTGEFSDILAFRNPDGSIILVMANKSDEDKTVSAKIGERNVTMTLPSNSINTIKVG